MSDGYLGNPLLKRSGVPIEWTPALMQEYKKCADDVIYFAEKYVKIVHVDHGFIPIKLYDYQVEIIESISDLRNVVVNASRQCGKCVSADTFITIKIGNNILNLTMGELHKTILAEKNIANRPKYDDVSCRKIKYSELKYFIEKQENNVKKETLDSKINRKFVDVLDIKKDIFVDTPTGWEKISKFNVTIPYKKFRIEFDDNFIECADDHIFIKENGEQIFAKDSIGSSIISKNGVSIVKEVIDCCTEETMYDLTVDSNEHVYYTNGILSHNTTTATVVILHYMLFQEHKTVGLLANKAASAVEILSRIQQAYLALPPWLQQGVVTWNKGSMELENGCKVIAAASSSSSIRGKTCVAGNTRVCVEKGNDYYYTEINKIINKEGSSK